MSRRRGPKGHDADKDTADALAHLLPDRPVVCGWAEGPCGSEVEENGMGTESLTVLTWASFKGTRDGKNLVSRYTGCRIPFWERSQESRWLTRLTKVFEQRSGTSVSELQLTMNPEASATGEIA